MEPTEIMEPIENELKTIYRVQQLQQSVITLRREAPRAYNELLKLELQDFVHNLTQGDIKMKCDPVHIPEVKPYNEKSTVQSEVNIQDIKKLVLSLQYCMKSLEKKRH